MLCIIKFESRTRALWSEGIVVVLPGEPRLSVAARGERLEDLYNVEILGIKVVVLGQIEVLFRDEDALAEEVFMDFAAVGLWNQHLDD